MDVGLLQKTFITGRWLIYHVVSTHTHTHTHTRTHTHTHAHTHVQISVDFFQFFMASAKVLEADTTVFCVSAWNDHGQEHHVLDPAALYRSDFFPGLGWMTHKVRNMRVMPAVSANLREAFFLRLFRTTVYGRVRLCLRAGQVNQCCIVG